MKAMYPKSEYSSVAFYELMLSAGQFALPFHNFLGSLIYMRLLEINTLNFFTCKSEGILAITYTPYSKMAANKLFFCLHVN